MNKNPIAPKILLVALTLFGGYVSAQTAQLPLTTIPNGPQSGTVANGVVWNVNIGTAWSVPGADQPGAAYYGFRPMDGIQTWTFSEAVNLKFVVNGLQGLGEGVVLPPSTQCSVPAVNLGVIWDAGTSTLSHPGVYNGPSGGVQIPCSLDQVTSLSLDGTGLGPADYRRGLASLEVTRLSSMTVAFSNVPSTMVVGESTQATLTCTNAGPGVSANATCVPVIASGDVSVSNLVCTPQPPIAALAASDNITCTFTLTANAIGPALLEGTATSDTSPAANTAVQLTVASPQPPQPTATPQPVPTLGHLGLALLTCAMGLLVARRR